MADTQALFEQLKQRFDPTAAADLEAVFQYCIDDESEYFFVVQDQQCTLQPGAHDDPSVTLSMDSETLVEVLSGETDGMQAFMAGRIQASGDVMLAARLAELFPIR